ncbi:TRANSCRIPTION FACTOR MYB8-RELATED-RELATED [Salix viminalis]|uniref:TRANSCRIPTION FACTOR MYB8-RELATED-RELATED n=1 Tax=Salix viminalis TaxID=40686 RepID=A0A9Q0NM92_SALVM|nr:TRANSCRIPTION FACTOR MYB8-RELATED-RELATED [Salix viminalis]
MKGAAGNGAEHRRGLWTVEEDRILTDHVKLILVKSGKICGLNEVNYIKRKCKINASSSKSSKESGANSRTELKSNDDGSISCRKDEAEIHNVMEDSSEKVRETTSLQDPVLIGDCYDNFWDPYLCAPNLMEFLDQSLDLFWDGM